jgi:prepilin signal peptidase PulO-like enzyme (type II secretory pathway)
LILLITSFPVVVSDIISFRIRNRDLLFSAAALITFLSCISPGLLIARGTAAAAGFVLAFAVRLLCKSGFGMGDVKYCALLAFAAGFTRYCIILFVASLFGLFAFLLLFLFKGSNRPRVLPFAPCLYLSLILLSAIDIPVILGVLL